MVRRKQAEPVRNPFARKHVTQVGNFGITQGDIFTPGAEAYAPTRLYSDPLFIVRGAGVIPKMQFKELQPPQVMQALTLPTSPYQGIPFGTLALQGLLDEEPNIAPAG
jgi:hypothetical protein